MIGTGPFAYGAIFLAAIVEGEVVFVGAAVPAVLIVAFVWWLSRDLRES